MFKKLLFFSLLVVLTFTSMFTTSASAYTYGDPNKEEVAEAYKEILLKLDQDPPNFVEAREIYESVKKEVDMHMGAEPSEIILAGMDSKDKEATIENMEKLLVLNIARRMESIEGNFTEYDTSKKLLAKAFATYEALSPRVEAENPEIDKELKASFDEALNALGNPGLFGVGKKESDLEAFKTNKEKILSHLQKEFQLKSLEVGHFSDSATETESTGKKEWTDISNIRNWIPLILISAAIVGVIVFTIRKRNRK
ncbi:hypothetical protein M3175_17730 [Robertmurraya korlensis]|uniref:hypothetical protein n=1 Tax=Robertmurraya korlensis TaxID=519977 RepID=UPI0020416635|nr:hypothetical protein [Robertmurraya korlensis]MCM3602576.1 hypothetical protein [Robertmurraya korlensis]